MGNFDRDFVYRHIHDLISDGINLMKDRNLSNSSTEVWIKYSEKVLELTTKEYNPSILMNYLRIVSTIDEYMPAYQKVGVCLDYLIRVLQMI